LADHIIKAEIAGVVFSIEVAVGEQVAADQSVVVLEAMKMHIPAEAPGAGTVAEVLVAVGDVVAEGQPLVRLS
jgi:biotin carboxyl carrier protein